MTMTTTMMTHLLEIEARVRPITVYDARSLAVELRCKLHNDSLCSFGALSDGARDGNWNRVDSANK